MKLITLCLLILAGFNAYAQPGAEILLFDLKVKKNSVEVKNPVNITNHKGYDNQPSFHSEKPLVYYSSFNDDGRSDLKQYNYQSGTTTAVTSTSEREYSPTLTPDKNFISCIIQRDNNAQDLGKYPVDGGEPTVIINNLIVGYHVWADNSHLGLFVLGDPNTLHYLRLPTKEDTVIAQNIGRSLHRIPHERAISFVSKTNEKNWIIQKLDTESLKVSMIAATLPGREDIAWTPNGRLLTSDGDKLYWLDGKEWKAITITKGAELLKGVTRLAVSPKGDKLAVVISE